MTTEKKCPRCCGEVEGSHQFGLCGPCARRPVDMVREAENKGRNLEAFGRQVDEVPYASSIAMAIHLHLAPIRGRGWQK